MERQLTREARNHILTNINVWSPNGRWIVFDTRSDAEGSRFDGCHIFLVRTETGEIRPLYESRHGAHCGVATFDPAQDRVAFILGPENPTPDWQYGPAHRQGVIVDLSAPGVAQPLDARDLRPPRTPGALRGGSHVHVFHPAGDWLSFTYNDALLPNSLAPHPGADSDARNVAIAFPLSEPLRVPPDHPRNHDGGYFTVLATRTADEPRPGSDDISLAQEEGWIGAAGYIRSDGTRQRRALAFQGTVLTAEGRRVVEVFVADLPDDPTHPSSDGPLEGTPTRRPLPPLGTIQRRLTHTADRKFPGIQGPRHWLRSSPDGSAIATLMCDDNGIVQLWTVSPNDGDTLRQLTHDLHDVASAFTYSPDGRTITYIADGSVFTVEVAAGLSRRLTPPWPDPADAPLPLACVFSPDGRQIAYLRRIPDTDSGERYNQIFLVTLDEGDTFVG